ncbi:hypothetical protein AVEN_64844-1 [Araneus ventricosus]|uniref:Uncharacterized protein n=1 Tax=Araneus ventricosus TaxID=182803 RepID=A0A4Y2GJA8_ARAVE|nr:hypothetical protein AVEN_64844-1 [Araneus ventricosus]
MKMIDGIQTHLCPLHGIKCSNSKECDCNQLCENGDQYVVYRVLPGDRIYVLDRLLTPGAYCLPKGVGTCNQQTSDHIFSLSGWSCVPKNKTIYSNDKMMACQHPDFKDNESNVLWDYKKNTPVNHDEVEDYYETMGKSGMLRYRCRCDGKDGLDKPLVNIVPFVCATDHCLKDIVNPLPSMGWDGSVCQCGPFFHENDKDETSPCLTEKTRIENGKMIVRVECMNDNSYIAQPFYCPNREGALSFTIPFTLDNDTGSFLKKHKDFYEN